MDVEYYCINFYIAKTLKIIPILSSKLQCLEIARWPENMSRHHRSFGIWLQALNYAINLTVVLQTFPGEHKGSEAQTLWSWGEPAGVKSTTASHNDTLGNTKKIEWC